MTTGTLMIQTEKKVKIVDTLQVLISVLAAELDLNFEQQRTADLLTPKMLKASCYWSMSRTSLTKSMLLNSECNIATACSSPVPSTSSDLLPSQQLHPMIEFWSCTAQQRLSFARSFWDFLFSPFFQEPISNQSVESSPVFLPCFHIAPYPEFDHLTY